MPMGNTDDKGAVARIVREDPSVLARLGRLGFTGWELVGHDDSDAIISSTSTWQKLLVCCFLGEASQKAVTNVMIHEIRANLMSYCPQ
ncbi:hypothetical protein SERLA73DRAFT_183921 [Serpula lacrymans var. lacrymans S7.3]|uniref:Uncharacterized protein n=1 Tax=Serpula lacrymans var. lacrymans (strain S7.3) TaxID=936435 RepID=F8Q250_SERL3|nr:hypothetical protein SERLA73DRAFT_183921 [Serpula lacrymans var. lacrymans S7.3]